MSQIDAQVDYRLRRQLNDEVHARPPVSLPTPSSLCYLARVAARDNGGTPSRQVLKSLLARYDVTSPKRGVNHITAMLGDVSLRWERHTEYSRFTFVSTVATTAAPFAMQDESCIPNDWLATMQGEVLVGVRACVVSADDVPDSIVELSRKYFAGNILLGSWVADGNAIALTDLRIHADGFSRIMLVNHGMSAAQTGRVMQRLFEIETYRMMALLALPVAQDLKPVLDEDETELADIAQALIDPEAHDEQQLLERLTRLSARSQNRHLSSSYRFSAADAYYDIVQQRIHELREGRIPGLQTFEEFTERRLAPAVKTYRAVGRRQQSILEQMARATKLLSTKIDIARQQQNQSLLASMNRRAKAQLRLQATVEGLSVAAVTYYVVGLVGILAEGAAASGLPLNKAIVMGVSIPIVAGTAFIGIRRLRRRISKEDTE